ncbi:MAG TPA: ABC transporter substrate-binding protein [Alphaproteobacteria bacterium]|nr:ABC transporter substrate-binding protein [Alphaproteobacteria bacterium]
MTGISRRVLLAGLGAPFVISSARRAFSCGNGETLRIRCSQDFSSFDPADCWYEDAIIARNIFAPLVRYKHRASEDESWAWENHLVKQIGDDGGMRFQFDLRDNEDWPGGAAVSSDDVQYSLERIAGKGANPIKAENRYLLSKLDHVEVQSAQSGTIKLTSKDDFRLTTLPTQVGCIISRKHVDSLVDKKFDLSPGPTSGRYALTGVYRGDRAELACDETWQGDAVTYSKALFRYVPDDEAAQKMVKAGEIDVYRASPDVLHFVGQPGFLSDKGLIHRASSSSVLYLFISTISNAMRRPEARRAVQLAIDPQTTAAAAYGELLGKAARGLIAPGWEGSPTEPLIAFDPDEGKRLAVKAGIGATALTCVYRANSPIQQRAIAKIAEQLKAVGIELKAIEVEAPQVAEAFSKGDADIGLFYASASPGSITDAMATFTSESPFVKLQGQAYQSAKFDQMFSATNESPSPEGYLSLQKFLVEEGAVLPLAEDFEAWWIVNGILPSFSPDGLIGDLGSWTTDK